LDLETVQAISESVSMEEPVGYLEVIGANEAPVFKYGDRESAIFIESRDIMWGATLVGAVTVGFDVTFRKTVMRDVAGAALTVGAIVTLLQGVFIAWLLPRCLKRPIDNLHSMADSYSRGVYHPSGQVEYREFSDVTSAMARMGRTILSQVTELQASEARMRSFYVQSPLGIFRTSVDGKLLDANPALVNMLGGESLGALHAYYKDIGQDLYVHQHDRDWLLAGVMSHPHGVVVEVELRRVDGEVFVGRLHAVRAQDNPSVIDGLIEDVTEQRQAQERLRLSEEKFEQLFMRSPYPIFLEDVPFRTIADANEAFYALIQRPREECVGRSFAQIVEIADYSVAFKVNNLIMEDGVLDAIECPVKTQSGEDRVFSLTARPVVLDSTLHVMVVAQDVTEQKSLREGIVHSEKMASVGRITAGVAHEINNPLGIILQASQNLANRLNPGFPPNVKSAKEANLDLAALGRYVEARKILEFTKDIQEAGLRAASIIRNMLDFSRKNSSCRVLCDVSVVMDRAIQLASSDHDFRRNLDRGRIVISPHVEKGLPRVCCSEVEIEQVLINLIRNAAHALANNAAQVAPPRIDVRASSVPGYVELEVRDNGPGMPEDVRKRVFEPFFTTKPPGQGTGLGLSVSYFIVTSGHGGEMTVESAPRRGACFKIKLPIQGDPCG
jgi:PAS domain S-box-containing protein